MTSLPAPKNIALNHVLALGAPPLLPHESMSHYTALAASIVNATEPRGAIEEILVRDVIDLTWEIKRLRAAKAGLLTLTMGESVQSVLDEIGYDGRQLKEGWDRNTKRGRSAVYKSLDRGGLSIADLTADALEKKIDAIERFDRMLASTEARRNNALREIDRHREVLGSAARRAVEEVEDCEFIDLETGVVHAPGTNDGLV